MSGATTALVTPPVPSPCTPPEAATSTARRPGQPVQEIGPFRVLTARVEHPVEAYALRLEADGATLTYSGDTAPCEALDELASGADVLLAEATYVDGRDNPPLLHLTGREAGETAQRAGVGRLVVTHVPPWESWEDAVAEAATTYAGPVLQAAPGLVLEV